MKKPLFLTVYFLLFSVSAFCQNWAPIGAEWHYNFSFDAPSFSEYVHYKVTKDTIFEGKSCRKVEGTWYRYRKAEILNEGPYFTYQSGDTVYYYHKDFKKYVPAYIFNVSAGDTLTFYTPFASSHRDTTFHVVVDSVKPVIIDSKTFRKIYLGKIPGDSMPVMGGSYIETIGSESVFLNPFYWMETANSVKFIRCYKDDSIFVKFTNIACDFRETAGISQLIQAKNLYIYPNPASKKLFIQNLEIKDNYRFYIYNQLGINVKSGYLTNFSKEINIEELTGGIYFLKVNLNNNQVQTLKFFKN